MFSDLNDLDRELCVVVRVVYRVIQSATSFCIVLQTRIGRPAPALRQHKPPLHK